MKIDIKPSSRLFIFFFLIHTLAALSIILSGADLWVKIIGVFICVISLFHVLRKYVCHKSNPSVQQLILDKEQQWWVVQKNGAAIQVSVQSDTLVTPFLLILNFEKFYLLPEKSILGAIKHFIGRNYFSLLVCPDSVKVADDFRKLCVQLRTQ